MSLPLTNTSAPLSNTPPKPLSTLPVTANPEVTVNMARYSGFRKVSNKSWIIMPVLYGYLPLTVNTVSRTTVSIETKNTISEGETSNLGG